MLDDSAADELLDEVRRWSLFVTGLDEEGGEWLRYHHLFAELLQRELHQLPRAGGVLHRRAAEWYAANGPPEDAVVHASATGDGQYAAALLDDRWLGFTRQCRPRPRTPTLYYQLLVSSD